MENLYHYTESGLDNIYLVNGVVQTKTPYGEVTKIEHMEQLHATIGSIICGESNLINNKEFRYLRVEMGLSQKNLGEFMGVDSQTIARWEKGETDIKGPADRMIRVLYLEHIKEDSSLKKLCDELSKIDNQDHEDLSFELNTNTGWNIAA